MAKTKVHGEYLDASVISGQTQVTAVGADSVLIFDATDNALKKALLSDVIETVADGDISTAKLADDAVTSAKIDTNIDIAGTFDVTGATTLDSTLTVAGDVNFDSGTLFVDVSADKVGIGTTSPDYPVEIEANNLSTGLPQFVVKGKDNDLTGIGLVAYGSNASHRNWGIAANQTAAGALNIGYTANSTNAPSTGNITSAFFIDSSGNVGIRNTSPASHNSLGGNHLVVGDGTGNQNLYLYSATDGYGHVAFGDSNTNGSSAQYAGLIQYHHTNDIMQFYTGSAERMRLTGSGLTFNGDSAAANALDDYETGSWTPDCSTSAGDSSIGVTVNYAKYIKIGDLVFVSCYLSLSVNTAGSGAGRVTGLPFAVGTNSGYHIGALAHANAVVAQGTNGVAFYAQQGQSYVRFVNVTDTGNVGFVQGGSKYLMMSVVYTTQSY